MTRICLALSLIGLILVGATSTSHAQEIAPADYAAVNAALVETHALPRYEQLATATEAFAVAAEAFCTGESDAEHERLRVGFHDAMDAWMGVQHLRFGPVDSRMRGFRFYFWPQARSKAGEAVAELVAAGEDDAALAARIGRVNVAVQGLLAAEVLLYEARYLGADAKGCGLLAAIAENMRTMAAEIPAEWREGDDAFARLMTAPRSGALRRELTLEPALHLLSIRHIAMGPDDTVAVAIQYEGPAQDCVPLVALQRGGGPLRLLQGPHAVLRTMKNSCGSVCFDPDGRTIAVSAPRGNLVTFWDAGTGRYLSSSKVSDGCGVAPSLRPGVFLASSGRGGVVVIDTRAGTARPLALDGLEAARWDNHLVAAPVS